uniref:Uncharacterized protein n=1 Tax=Arundo donax TaxID=35708 RepID=A0A0A8YDW2_ARUDO
MTNNIKTEA